MSDATFVEKELPYSDSAKILKSRDYEMLSLARAGVDSAADEAAAIVEKAKADAKQIREDALKTGKREAAAFAAEHATRTKHDLETLEPKLTNIVIDALRRILEPIPSEKLIVAAAQKAIAEIDLSRGATLIVAPDRLPKVQEYLKSLPVGQTGLDLRGDPSCALESSILRTPYGDIELDVETQLAALAEGIEAALAEPVR